MMVFLQMVSNRQVFEPLFHKTYFLTFHVSTIISCNMNGCLSLCFHVFIFLQFFFWKKTSVIVAWRHEVSFTVTAVMEAELKKENYRHMNVIRIHIVRFIFLSRPKSQPFITAYKYISENTNHYTFNKYWRM